MVKGQMGKCAETLAVLMLTKESHGTQQSQMML
jgi:hypothetical protein